MEEKILTSDQVAEKLQIHPFTVLKFIKQGKLQASKLGRVYRIRESDVSRFLDNQLTQQNHGGRSESRTKKDQRVKTPGEIVSPSKEISSDPLRLGSESKEEALQPKTLSPEVQKVSPKIPESKNDVPTDPEPDHYYILD